MEKDKPNRIHRVEIDFENIVKVSKMDKIYLSFNKEKDKNQMVLLVFDYNYKIEKHYCFPFCPLEFYTLIASINSDDLLVRRKDESGKFLNHKEDVDYVKNKMIELLNCSGYQTLENWLNASYLKLPRYIYECNIFVVKSSYIKDNLVNNQIKINKKKSTIKNKTIIEFNCNEFDVVNESMKRIKKYLSALD